MTKITCDLIVTDQPTINGRIYSKECMEKMLLEMKAQIKNNGLLVYASIPDVTDYFEPPTFDKVVGKVTDVNLTDRFDYTVININTELSKAIDFADESYQLVPVVWGNVNKNEITGNFEVSNVTFKYLNLGMKNMGYKINIEDINDAEG